MNIILGILGLIASYYMVKFRGQIGDMLGRVDFAEKFLGSTYNLVVLVAIGIAFVSLLFIFGMQDLLKPDVANMQI